MARLTRKSVVTLPIYTENTLVTTSLKSLPAWNFTYQTLGATMLDARPYIGQFQPDAPYIGDKFTQLGFSFNLYGQSATGVPYHFTPVLRAAGFDYDITTGGTAALGDLHIDGETPDGDTVTFPCRINVDGYEQISFNNVADLDIEFSAGQIPTVNARLLGHIGVGHAASVVTASTAQTALQTLLTPTPSKLMGGTIGGVSGLTIAKFTYALNNRLSPRMDVNGVEGRSQTQIVDRNPSGMLYVEVTDISTFNPETIWSARTSTACAFTHNDGGAAWDEIAVGWTCYFSDVPQKVDVDGVLCWEIPFVQHPSSGPLTLVWSDN